MSLECQHLHFEHVDYVTLHMYDQKLFVVLVTYWQPYRTSGKNDTISLIDRMLNLRHLFLRYVSYVIMTGLL